jgi:hypothetical protein
MEPGFYVVRMPKNGAGSRLMIESRPFRIIPEFGRDVALRQAENWKDVIQSQRPDDDVFIIER